MYRKIKIQNSILKFEKKNFSFLNTLKFKDCLSNKKGKMY